MALRIVYHEDFMKHSPDPYDHPENPSRLVAALKGLEESGVYRVSESISPPEGDVGLYTKVHSPAYLRHVLSMAESGLDWLDPDTYVGPGTIVALKRLAGASLEAYNIARRGGVALLLGRPPGHHAGIRGRALGAPTAGFCIVNTAALIARLLSQHGRTAMLDFDLHHGNGTQEIFYDDPEIYHVDIHQDPTTIYPGTGFPEDLGEGEARGTKINIIIPPYSGDDIFLSAARVAIRILERLEPDYIVVSAGFDAYRGDNAFTVMKGGTTMYHMIGSRLPSIARSGVAAVLEGGYGVGLRRALPSFAAGLAGLGNPYPEAEETSSGNVRKLYAAALRRLARALEGLKRSC
ncbi:histone deacetylase family protein [Aeropyrum camini]|uniref:histone deacetylase family protein n=1 Tax=Aeropyrum camini TaxID=229980 RepID=UPI000786B383|nr:histone deacetylase family protein [Aeropyrum camini]